ncbi:MAG: hypothetical protein H6733_17490 [Alphaproteobacteria bacterium]|nr:hypothetical protein [Alphaproteobacteria bacterium]
MLAAGIALVSSGPPDAAALVDLSGPRELTPVAPMAVRILPVARVPEARWGTETAGAVLLALETALGDVAGVVPRIDGVDATPGFADALSEPGLAASLTVTVDLVDEALGVDVVACDVDDHCTAHHAVGVRTQPNAPVAVIVRELAHAWDRELSVDLAAWAQPETRDPYAALLLGRAGAVLTGLMPPVEETARGDVRRDPLVRAAFLDPGMPTGQLVVARTATEPSRRVESASLAARAMPSSLARQADLAATQASVGQLDVAAATWAEVARRSPRDARFVLPRARLALALGDAEGAASVVAELGGHWDDDPVVVAVEVGVADAKDGADAVLLAHWQEVDPDNAEPVRRRIGRRVADGDREGALALTDELARRGEPREAQRLTLALASDLGRWQVAAEAASELGQPEVAARLRAAGSANDVDARVAALAAATSPEARLSHASSLLRQGQARHALELVQGVLVDEPWWPEALDVQAQSLAALGDADGAARARARLLHADPLYFEGDR